MASMQDQDVRDLLNLHWRRHKHTALYRLKAEVKDYLRRVAGLAPDCRNMEDTIGELTPVAVHTALVIAQSTSTDITKLHRDE